MAAGVSKSLTYSEFLYDYNTMRHGLEAAGFRNCRRCAHGHNTIVALSGIDAHVEDYARRFETFLLEAERPSN